MTPRTEAEVRRVFHATAVVSDRDAAVAELCGPLGGVVLHKAEGDTFGVDMRRAMVWLGDNLLEVIEPVGESPFSGFLSRFGGGLNALGLQVGEMGATEARLAASGVEVAVRYNEQMVATRTRSTAGLALQFTSQWVPDDPRAPGGSAPRVSTADPAPRRMAFMAAVVDDPSSAALVLAPIFGTWAATYEPDALPGPEAAVGIGDCTLALYRTSATDRTAWGRVQDRPRLVALGLDVPDPAAVLAAATAPGTPPPVRHRFGSLMTLPSGLLILVGNGLLPGDPRQA